MIIRIKKKKCFVYFVLDTRKKGPYVYKHKKDGKVTHKASFSYEPFYVGISNYENRTYATRRNKFYNRLKTKILAVGLKPKVIVKEIRGKRKLLCFYEQYYIELIGRRWLGLGPLTNITPGGDTGSTGWIPSKEHRKILSERMKKYNPMFNPDTVAKVVAKSKGRKWSKEARRKNKIRRKKYFSGENNSFYGEHHTKKNLRYMAEIKNNIYFLISPEGRMIITKNLKRTCNKYNLKYSGVLRLHQKNRKGIMGSVKGWQCKKLEPSVRNIFANPH